MLRILSRKNYRYAQYNINLGQSLAEEDVEKKGKQLEMQLEKSIIESVLHSMKSEYIFVCISVCRMQQIKRKEILYSIKINCIAIKINAIQISKSIIRKQRRKL